MRLNYLLCSNKSSKQKRTRQKASTVRPLVPVTPLHSVCGLDTIRHNTTNSASLPQLHCFTGQHTDVTESTWPNLLHLFDFQLILCLGARYSTEIQRVITPNQRSLSSGLHCTFARRLSWPTAYPEEENPVPVNHGTDVRFLLEPINTNLDAPEQLVPSAL